LSTEEQLNDEVELKNIQDRSHGKTLLRLHAEQKEIITQKPYLRKKKN
jgi:hypothetical protein